MVLLWCCVLDIQEGNERRYEPMTNTRFNKEASEQNKGMRSPKKPFVSPQIVEIGSAVELIQGGGKHPNDDGPDLAMARWS